MGGYVAGLYHHAINFHCIVWMDCPTSLQIGAQRAVWLFLYKKYELGGFCIIELSLVHPSPRGKKGFMICLVSAMSRVVLSELHVLSTFIFASALQIRFCQPHCRERPSVSDLQSPE